MPSLSLLIKPSSGGCNIRCNYCFYHDEQLHRETFSYGSMSEETLETLVKSALSYATTRCSFGFQGGEPTLRGLGFYRRLVQLQKQYNVHHAEIANAIQTNGLLLDSEWAQFLRENRFLVGLSLDGTKDVHDENRLDPGGKGTFNRVLQAAQKLAAHQVEFNLLTVVTNRTAENIAKIYNFYRRSGFPYQQYIPCLDPLDEDRGASPYSLTPEKYASFLTTLFDLWYRDVTAGKFIYIRYFENLLGMLLGCPPEHCGLSGQCVIQYVVEADGSVYPCDFYCLDEWRLGNIREQGFRALATCETAKRFLQQGSAGRQGCQTCPYAPVCRGGCRRDREPLAAGSNYFCPAYKAFFAYALPRLQVLARSIRQQEGGRLR
ncbi:anaerobic sulfatase maturase [Acutalibacter caecimuris]|uniref:anaerobic sulfatase maturase n=1 Tax=Acutalibacter caecimuris TaxID=3093657 RepID=UPI002AC9775B|nr:anaerobic sulfatase maturase [Acutalibacter sp. M00118]